LKIFIRMCNRAKVICSGVSVGETALMVIKVNLVFGQFERVIFSPIAGVGKLPIYY